ncbi:MAG: DinB family protein [Aeromicrobium sp.]
MSAATTVLDDTFTRIGEGVASVVDGLSTDDLAHRIAPGANPIGWLVWHLLRVQDDHVSDVAGTDQVWTAGGWHGRFDVPFESGATGYGQSADDVAALTTTSDLLAGYAQAVTAATLEFVAGLTDEDLDRVVDDAWDPPVTLGARLVSVIGDDLKHLGQAEYVAGLL